MLIKEVNGQIVITHVGVREFSLNPESEFDKEQWKNDIERAADDVLKRNYNDIYGAIPGASCLSFFPFAISLFFFFNRRVESDRVPFADYKKNLQRQLEFIPLPVEMAKRGVSTRKENEVFALGSVAMPTEAPASGGGSANYTSKRENSPPRMPVPASLPGALAVPQVQAAAAARSSSPKRTPPAPPPKAKNLIPTSMSGQVQQDAAIDATATTTQAEEVLEAR